MTADSRKPKVSAEITSENLLFLCRAKRFSVASLARHIKRSRQAIYFAVENPRRYSITFRKIKSALL